MILKKLFLISIYSFTEAHTFENIDHYINETLLEYFVNKNIPLITDYIENMLKLKISHPVVVYLPHLLCTVVSIVFKELTNKNKVISRVGRNMYFKVKIYAYSIPFCINMSKYVKIYNLLIFIITQRYSI